MKTNMVTALALVAAGGVLAAAAARSFAAPAADEMPAAKLQQVFSEASRAYDAGRLDDAVSLYEGLLADGHVSAELLYNLGNAYFRLGKIGQAVLDYRRASYLAPRDPDILANLRFAQQSAGALPPTFAVWSRFLLRFSRAEWVVTAVTAYWLAAATACVLILAPRRRDVFLRAGILLAAVLAVSLAGLWQWHRLAQRPELVVVEPGQQARFAPLDGSTAHFSLPEGSVVRAVDASGPWIKITSGKNSGWVRGAGCAAVSAWHSGGGGLTLGTD